MDGSRRHPLRFRTVRIEWEAIEAHGRIGADGSIWAPATRVGRWLQRTDLDELPLLIDSMLGRAPLRPPGVTWREVFGALFDRHKSPS